MAGSKSDYFENRVLELAVGKTAMTLPTVYVALFTTDPGEANGGAEVSGSGYARKQTAGSDWGSASGGSLSNANDLVFATPTGSWGTPGWWALMDASSGGNMLYHATITTPAAIGANALVHFPAGSLVLGED